MELNPKELLIDAILVTGEVAKFVGERAIGGAWGLLASKVHFPPEVKPANIQIYDSNIERGQE